MGAMSFLASVKRRVRSGYIHRKWRWLRANRSTVTVRTRQGILTVSTRDDVIGQLLFTDGHFQHDLVCNALSMLRGARFLPKRGTGTFVDIGANMGVISVGLLVADEFADVIGIEPDPLNFSLLERNIEQNDLTARARLMQAAATATRTAVPLGLSPDNFGDHRIGETTGRATVLVDGQPLDELVGDATPALVWIDTQGHEASVLAGGGSVFRTGVPTVMEVWPFALERSWRGSAELCRLAAEYWDTFWVWRRAGRFVPYPIDQLPKFCEELGTERDEFDDVILTRAQVGIYSLAFCNAAVDLSVYF
jgi:FkbM family methyltransferase